MVTTVDISESGILGTVSDATVTLVSPNLKPCIFDEEAMSDSFSETPALSIPKLNFMADCELESGLIFSHCTHFNESLLI